MLYPRLHRSMGTSFRSKATALAVLAAAVLAFCVWRRKGSDEAGTSVADPSLIDGRLWVGSMPDKHTDYVQAAVFISAANFGLFERASSYDIHAEIFDTTRDTKNVKLTFPQSGKSTSFGFSVTECKDLAPFDLCLDITRNPWGGPKRYHGFSRPEQEGEALGPLAARLRENARAAPGQ
jgi:hypothetical protein